jgi:Zn finger protein HypA/HybF involved in hydrogenase expression
MKTGSLVRLFGVVLLSGCQASKNSHPTFKQSSSAPGNCNGCERSFDRSELILRCRGCGKSFGGTDPLVKCQKCGTLEPIDQRTFSCPECKKELHYWEFTRLATTMIKCGAQHDVRPTDAKGSCGRCGGPVSYRDAMRCPACYKEVLVTGRCGACLDAASDRSKRPLRRPDPGSH